MVSEPRGSASRIPSRRSQRNVPERHVQGRQGLSPRLPSSARLTGNSRVNLETRETRTRPKSARSLLRDDLGRVLSMHASRREPKTAVILLNSRPTHPTSRSTTTTPSLARLPWVEIQERVSIQALRQSSSKASLARRPPSASSTKSIRVSSFDPT